MLNKEKPEIDTSGCSIIVEQDAIKCYCKEGILTFNTDTLNFKQEMT